MKIRKVKKQIKKCVGFMAANGLNVYNCVTDPEYTGGSCVELDEDCYRIEVVYTRKRYGAPLLLTGKMMSVYNKFQEKLVS